MAAEPQPPADDAEAPAKNPAEDWTAPDEVTGREPITVPLLEPVKHGGQMLTSITLQPLKGRHLKTLPVDPAQMTVGSVMAVAATQAQLPNSCIEELGVADLARVLGVTNCFLAIIQGSGGT